MSFLSKLLPFVAKTDADVEAAVAKINAKAAADVAVLRASATASKAKVDKAAKVAAFEAALADYKSYLAAQATAPVAAPPTPKSV